MSVGRQFGLAATGGDPKLKLPLVAAVDATRKETTVKSAIAQIAEISAPRETKAAAGIKVPPIKVPSESNNLVPQRGRPPKHDAEPWKAAGVSRRTWFRQQKANPDNRTKAG